MSIILLQGTFHNILDVVSGLCVFQSKQPGDQILGRFELLVAELAYIQHETTGVLCFDLHLPTRVDFAGVGHRPMCVS